MYTNVYLHVSQPVCVTCVLTRLDAVHRGEACAEADENGMVDMKRPGIYAFTPGTMCVVAEGLPGANVISPTGLFNVPEALVERVVAMAVDYVDKSPPDPKDKQNGRCTVKQMRDKVIMKLLSKEYEWMGAVFTIALVTLRHLASSKVEARPLCSDD